LRVIAGLEAVGGDPRTRPSIAADTLAQAAGGVSPRQSGSPSQWIWLNGIGGSAPSSVTCTGLCRSRARSASARTHSDCAAAAVHSTSTALASSNFSRMTSA
jgi:hypothetical protein